MTIWTKKVLSIPVTLMFAGALLLAQSEGSSQSATPPTAPQTEQESRNPQIQTHNFTGCLLKAADDYVMRADDGQFYKLNIADKSQLEQHVGKKIEVMAKDNTSPMLPTSVEGSPANLPVEVEFIREVSGDCPPETSVNTTGETQQSAQAGAQEGVAAQAEHGKSAEGSTESGAESAGRAAEAATATAASEAERGAERTGEAVESGARSAAGAVERGAERAGIDDPEREGVSAEQSGERTMAQANQPPAGQQDEQALLPQTASPLPLIALLGMGTLVAGIVSRRRR